MSLHAVENIGDAVTTTREFLLPFDSRRWLKLAFVVFFIGSGLGVPAFQFNMAGGPDQQSTAEMATSIPADLVTVLAVLVALGIVLALLFGSIGAIMEFVFIESLRRQEVAIRRDWANRWRQGIRLFVFRLALWIPMLVLVLGWIGAVVLLFLSGDGLLVPMTLFLGGIPLLFVLGLVVGLTSSFTTVFVVALMIQNDSGVLDGWRQLWPSIKADWNEYLAYALVAYALTFATRFLASFVVGLVALVLLIPVAIVATITAVTVSVLSPVGLVILVPVLAVFGLIVIGVSAVIQVPVLTYLRYYALLVLGDIDPAFDIISEHRDTIGA